MSLTIKVLRMLLGSFVPSARGSLLASNSITSGSRSSVLKH